ncbi:MAG: aldolase/citrate lyase family protein [Veillonellales bacterium]
MSLIENKIKARLLGGRTVTGSFLFSREPACAEILGYAGMDFVLIDTEHTPATSSELVHIVRAAEGSGAEPVVRVRTNDPALILQALDVGATGILVPRVNTAQAAKAVVRAAKYGPDGERGMAGMVRAAKYGFIAGKEYRTAANRNIFIMVQVEEVEAVRNLDEIIAVDGIDGIFIGPADLSQSMGLSGQFEHPDFHRTVLDVISRGRKAGKHVAIFCPGVADAKRWEQAGADIFAVSGDTVLLAQAAKQLLQDMGRQVGF